MEGYNPQQPTNKIIYLDMRNLSDSDMSQVLQTGRFQ